jgi:hypothetical protein
VTVKDASQPEAPTLQRVKKRRSSRKARNKSLLQPENLRMPAEVSSESQKRSEQVNGEIEAIDSVLKALDTSGYSMSDMTTTLSGCTGFPMHPCCGMAVSTYICIHFATMKMDSKAALLTAV